jgi:short-subunit dehydrogenase
MKQYTLITGASGGLGYAMAKQLAAQGHHLIIIARNAAKLQQLKTELETAYQVQVVPLPYDLAREQSAEALYTQVKEMGLQVNVLVNNAGVGTYGHFTQTSLTEEMDMINLNIKSLVTLCKLFGADMASRKQGKIMNVASLLSFLPFPYYSVYSATKAFVLAFSETLRAEMEDAGVVVTTLCPGPVDTGFTTQEMLATNAYKTNKPMGADVVARIAVKHLLHGSGIKSVGFMNWFISNLPRITPDKIMMKIKKQLASPAK